MVANCGEQNLIEKLRISSVNRNRYLEKKIIDISEQYLVLEADILLACEQAFGRAGN